MKPLILLLFVAISLQAQSLPELARKERRRQSGEKPKVVFTGEKPDTSTAVTPPEQASAKPAETKPDAQATKPAEPAKPASNKPADDLAKKYAEDIARLKAKIVELQDRDTATQLQLNDVKNQLLAPVTDTTARAQAQAKLDQMQTQLTAIQKELADARRALQVLEAKGPPKP